MDREDLGIPQLPVVIIEHPLAPGRPYGVSFLDEERKSGVFRPKRQLFGLKVKDIWAWLSMSAVVALVLGVVSCLRALHAETSSKDFARRLGGGGSENEKKELSAAVDACLDLEERIGLFQQPSSPLPGPSKAIPRILEFLTAKQEQLLEAGAGRQQAGSLWPWPPPGITTSVFSPQPGPSHVSDTGRGAECVKASDRSLLLVAFQQRISPVSSCAPRHPASTSLETADVSASHRESPLCPAGGSEESFLRGGSRPVSGQKRTLREPEISAPAMTRCKVPRVQHPQPRKHTSGWKARGRLQPPRDPFPPAGRQSLDSGTPDEDRLLVALQAVPLSWSPEPLDVSEWETAEVQESGQEEQQEDRFPMAMKAVHPDILLPVLELSPVEEPAAAKATKQTLAASSASPSSPTASALREASGQQRVASDDSLPGPSGLPPLVAPRGDAGRGPQAPPSPPLPGPAPLMPLDTHLFYRLPALQPGVSVPRFYAPGTFVRPLRHPKAMPYLQNVRELLALPELNATHVGLMVWHTEHLINYVLHAHQAPVGKVAPHRAIRDLGVRYLILEAIFCVIQILGPQMGAASWWPRLISSIPTDYQGYPLGPRTSEATRDHMEMARRLSAALQSLKNGIRPSLATTVSLKQQLLCGHDIVPLQFFGACGMCGTPEEGFYL